jgi:hypothetical protein
MTPNQRVTTGKIVFFLADGAPTAVRRLDAANHDEIAEPVIAGLRLNHDLLVGPVARDDIARQERLVAHFCPRSVQNGLWQIFVGE